MTGLPRSGSTLLAALLNQHPDIYASPHSDLLSMLYGLHDGIPYYESHKAGLMHAGFGNVKKELPDNFYAHIDKPIVIDKNRGWGTPYNWDNLSGYLNKRGKVILTMRPILEVLASYSKVISRTEKVLDYSPFLNEELWVTNYRNKRDAQIDNLMQLNGDIDKAIYSIANLLKNHGDRVFVVWFDDLLKKPQNTMDGVCDFLNLDRHIYDFNSIKETDKHNDVAGYQLLGLHDVAPKLAKPNTKPEKYLSDYIIGKYKNALSFLWN